MIHYWSYQKQMNLYLYILPGSAHPSNMIYGLIYRRFQVYRLQNTETADFVRMSILLARRLCARAGYSLQTLMLIFQKAKECLLKSDPRKILNPAEQLQDSYVKQNPLSFTYHTTPGASPVNKCVKPFWKP
jgi:hypothetical protein